MLIEPKVSDDLEFNQRETMNEAKIQHIQDRIEPYRTQLISHPIYAEIDCIEKLHVFMEGHIFAVWDFMSLLKALQREFCPASIPWVPPANPAAARLINEIVLGEETDEDCDGGYASHFDLYLEAMKSCGAGTDMMDRFLLSLQRSDSVQDALGRCGAPAPVCQFVTSTFEVIESHDPCRIASAFTFGREDLLPDVFQRVVDELNLETDGDLAKFRYYLDRHIELDGDVHGPMAAKLISSLCRTDETKWKIVEDSAVASLEARLTLWNGMHEMMKQMPPTTGSTMSLVR